MYLEGPFPGVAGWSYDIGRDGRILTCVNAEERSAPKLGIITNFHELILRWARQAGSR